MKQPSLSNLRRDHADTRGIRAAAKKGSVKITINIDRDSLEILRAMAQETRAEVVRAIIQGEVIEIYPADRPYPSYLILDVGTKPIHVVVSADPVARICHVITAYRPDTDHFEGDFRTRRKKI